MVVVERYSTVLLQINRLNTADCSLKWAPIIYALISYKIADNIGASTNQISLDSTLFIVCLVMQSMDKI